MSDVETDLRDRVAAFVGDLRAIVRRRTLLAVEELLQEDVAEHPPTTRPAHRFAPTAPARPAAPVKAARKTGEKRSPRRLQQLTDGLHAHLASNPGQTMEQIARALATPSRALTLPLRKLLAAKRISSRGQKRATRYYPR